MDYEEQYKNVMEKAEEYREKIGQTFPLAQAGSDLLKAIKDMNECIRLGKKAEELKPDIYGACVGKEI